MEYINPKANTEKLSDHFNSIEKYSWLANLCLFLLVLFPSAQADILSFPIHIPNSNILHILLLILIFGFQIALKVEWHFSGMPDSIFSFAFRYISLWIAFVLNFIFVAPHAFINTPFSGINRIYLLLFILLGRILGKYALSAIILAFYNIPPKEQAMQYLCPRIPFYCKIKILQGLILIAICSWIIVIFYFRITLLHLTFYFLCLLNSSIIGIISGCSKKKRFLFKSNARFTEQNCYISFATNKYHEMNSDNGMSIVNHKYIVKAHYDAQNYLYNSFKIHFKNRLNVNKILQHAQNVHEQNNSFIVYTNFDDDFHIYSFNISYKLFNQAIVFRQKSEKMYVINTIKSIIYSKILISWVHTFSTTQLDNLIFLLSQAGEAFILSELLPLIHHNLNYHLHYGWTPLLIASAQNYPEVVRLLLKYGANPDLTNLMQCSALLMASDHGFLSVVTILVDYGASLELKDRDGRTALDVAADKGHIDIVQFLLQKHAHFSNNTIQNCYKHNQGEIAKLLLSSRNNSQKK